MDNKSEKHHISPSTWKRIAEFTISFGLAVLILYALFRHFDLRATADSLRKAQPGPLVISIALMVVVDLLRGWRWRIWQRHLGFWDSVQVIQIGFMGNNVLPGRLGEFLRAHCASAKSHGEWGRTAALGSVVAERVLDGLVLGAFGMVAIAVVHMDRRLQWGLFLPSLAFAGLATCLVLSVRHQEWIRRFISAPDHKVPGRLTTFAGNKVCHLLDGIVPVGTWPRMLAAIISTGTIWCLECGICYLVGLSLWPGMRVQTALLFLVVVNFATLIPITMGGIGTIEAAGPLFLVSSGVSPQLAMAMVLLQHTGRYLFNTIAGAVFYLSGGFYGSLADRGAMEAPDICLNEPANASGVQANTVCEP